MKLPMERADIERILPHRHPFLWLDRVLAVEPGKFCRAEKTMTPEEPFFAGHFPGRPIVPGVIIVEALAQTLGLAIATPSETADGELPPPKIGYLAKADVKFLQIVRPGETLSLEARFLSRAGNLTQMHCIARVGSVTVVEGRITVSL